MGLAAPLDANCSATAKISYLLPIHQQHIQGTDHADRSLPDRSGHTTTTTDGRTIPYIVRVEAGTINRGVYRIAILDNPGPVLDRYRGNRDLGWNGKLIVTFGCCGSAQYNQGVISPDAILSDNGAVTWLCVRHSTELFNQQHANPHLQGETLMMLKEYFIKNYGVPKWTAGIGGSGGAIQQYLITQLYPGLLDGIQPSISFPETLMPCDMGMPVARSGLRYGSWLPGRRRSKMP